MSVFVVIPVYNETPEVLSAVIGQFPPDHFLVIVDDGSDEPIDISRENAELLRHEANKGQGAAIRTGIQYALENNASLIATFDADGQHRFSDLQRMEAAMAEGKYDVVLGSRFNSATVGIPLLKRLVLKGGVLIQNTIFGVRLTDAHNGLRLLSRKAAEKIRIREDRMAHASDIIYQLKLNRLSFTEIPIKVEYSSYAIKKGQSMFNALAILVLIFKIRMRK
jgi:glycosyltransferase involved in cell wall biosynthesis